MKNAEQTISQREELIKDREHLVNVRDSIPPFYEVSIRANELVAEIESMLGY